MSNIENTPVAHDPLEVTTWEDNVDETGQIKTVISDEQWIENLQQTGAQIYESFLTQATEKGLDNIPAHSETLQKMLNEWLSFVYLHSMRDIQLHHGLTDAKFVKPDGTLGNNLLWVINIGYNGRTLFAHAISFSQVYGGITT